MTKLAYDDDDDDDDDDLGRILRFSPTICEVTIISLRIVLVLTRKKVFLLF